MGQSYAIPTKDFNVYTTLPLPLIHKYVNDFLKFATDNPEKIFNIVAIGCGLAGYTAKQIAPMFKDCPSNCILPEEFIEVLHDTDTKEA